MSNMDESVEPVVCEMHVTARYRSTFVEVPGDEYVVPHDFQLVTSDNVVVGRLLGDLVCVSELADEALINICDSDSDALLHVCEALFVPGTGDLHEELNPSKEHVSRFLFIYRSVFLPCVLPATRQAMLYRIANSVLNYDDVIVGWSSLGELTPSALKELGYVRIAGSGMVFCRLTQRNPYSNFQELEGTVPPMTVIPPATAASDFEELWVATTDEISED